MITIKQLINIIKESIEEMPVFHGSGADFDKFNHKKFLDTGCGSQSFGWGTYVTDDKTIGDSYAKNAIDLNDIPDYSFKDGSIIWTDTIADKLDIPHKEAEKINSLLDDCDNINSLINVLNTSINNGKRNGIDKSYMDEWSKWVDDLNRLSSLIVKNDKSDIKSYLYHVDIPDDNGGNYLDWYGDVDDDIIDRVASGFDRLSPKYQKMIYRRLDDILWRRNKGQKVERDKDTIYNYFKKCDSGRNLYDNLRFMLGSQKAASLYLLNLCGFDGIKYETGTRWQKPDGAKTDGHNYVLFDINSPQITDKETMSIA